MKNFIPIDVKKTCLEMKASGISPRKIYNQYFRNQFDRPQAFAAFRVSLGKWEKNVFPDDMTLDAGTYDGFIAHGATVQVSKDGDIVQAWIKQKACDFNPEDFIEAIKASVIPYEYTPGAFEDASGMLEIPLFDMHWGISFMDYYEQTLKDVLNLIHSRKWNKIVVPFGQDFFHNDSITNSVTSNGTVIEKVDMARAVKEGQRFIYAIIDAAIACSEEVQVIYSAGNHDKSISWMFVQVLLERYGSSIVDDSIAYRKCITYGKNAVMITHGDSKRATPKNLASVFPISFPEEFAKSEIREIHAGHLHHESEADIFGVMVRRLSTGGKTDDWADKEDFVGSHKRFMLFNWGKDKLKAIYYI